MTTYRPAADLPGFRVGDDGSVWRQLKDGQWSRLKVQLRSGRNLAIVRFSLGGRRYNLSVANLILRSFGVPCPPGHHALHFPDSDPFNNRLSNLRWAPRNIWMIGAIRRVRFKLRDSDVLEIRTMAQSGEFFYRELAEQFGICEDYVYDLVKGRTRTSSPGPIDSPDVARIAVYRGEAHPNARLKDSDVLRIRELALSGEFSQSEIAELFMVHRSTVKLVISGRRWAHVPVASGGEE